MRGQFLALVQFFCDFLPGNSLFHHQNHHMVQKIGNLVLDLFRIWILRRNDDLGCFFSDFFEDLVNALFKQVIGVRAFFRMLFAVFDQFIEMVENDRRIGLMVIFLAPLPEWYRCRSRWRAV